MIGPTLLVIGCGAAQNEAPFPGAGPPETAAGQAWFVDRARETGLDFMHVAGMSGRFYQIEIMPPGVAFFDYDNDGDLDVYLVQGQPIDATAVAPANQPARGGRLFRNDLQTAADRQHTLRFTDVTEASRIRTVEYGMGAAAGDIDNDGCVDLFLTYYRANQLLRNNCDGTFTDISRRAGVVDAAWSVSASFLDFNRDGWLDLYVGNYLEYDVKTGKPCLGASGRPDYCLPREYPAQPDRLYRNNRNGTFSDVTRDAGIRDRSPALGVVSADFNGDGWIDIYVANDGQQNQLWINGRNGTFRDMALLSGSALPEHGKAEASMGVDAGDYDNDGDEDLFMTELTSEGSNLYVNDGTGMFEDRSARSGVGAPSLPLTGFGAAWFDFDSDGWLDLFTVNGKVEGSDSSRLPQPKQLFRNLGDGRFEDVTRQGGEVMNVAEIGRGAAFGDVDNDGDPDILIGNDNGPTRLLINEYGPRRHWLGLRLVGSAAKRDMLGARVAITLEGGKVLWRRVRSDASYASANDPRVLVGLGDSTAPPDVRVLWPGGVTEEWADVPIDRYTTLREGTGK